MYFMYLVLVSLKQQARALVNLDENRLAVRIRNPIRGQNESIHRGGERTIPLIMACSESRYVLKVLRADLQSKRSHKSIY